MSERKSGFDVWHEERMKDPEFAAWYEIYGLADRIAEEVVGLRKKSGMTQAELARRMETCQEVISRLETRRRSGLTVATLNKVAKAFGKKLEIKFV